MFVRFNLNFTFFGISRMLKDVIKYFKISKLFYSDKRIITISIFLIDIYDFLKKWYRIGKKQYLCQLTLC